jgi:hypothetical protein
LEASIAAALSFYQYSRLCLAWRSQGDIDPNVFGLAEAEAEARL